MYYVEPLSRWTEFRHFRPLEFLGKDVGDFPDHISLFGHSIMARFVLTEHAYEAFAINLMSLIYLDRVDPDSDNAFELVKYESTKILSEIQKEAGPSPLFISVEDKTKDLRFRKKFLLGITISLILIDLAIDELVEDRFSKATPFIADAIILCWRAQSLIQMTNINLQGEFTKFELDKLKAVQKSGGEARALRYQAAKEWVAERDDPKKWKFATKAASYLAPALWENLEESGLNPFSAESDLEKRVGDWVRLHRKGKLLKQ